VGAVWYSPLLFGKAYMELRGMNPAAMAGMKIPAGEMLGEFVHNLVIAFVLAHFVVRLGSATGRVRGSLDSGCGLGFKPCF
jgi:hypothetical protein